MTQRIKQTRWLVVVAVGNAVLLLGLAAVVAWLRTDNTSEQVSHAPLPAALEKSDPAMSERPLPIPPPPGMRRILPRPPGDEIIIDLDSEGNIRLGGEPVELRVLRTRLCQLNADHRRRAIVTIRASDDCLFRHVRDVMDVCDECVISTYTLSSPRHPSQLAQPGKNDVSAV